MTKKVAVVTGGTRGIGKSIVNALAHNNYDVVISGRSVNSEQQAWIDKLAKDTSSHVEAILYDLAKPENISLLFKDIKEKFGRVDVLINNAGYEIYEACEDISDEDWNKVIQVNLTAPFQCSKEAVKLIKEQKSGGVIINITSIHDSLPRKGVSAYCVAKAGLHMLTKVTSLEWAEYGIRVISVGPGAIETDMNKDAIDAFGRDKFNRWIPAQRVGNGDEVADLVCYLCDDKASYITGIDVHIDGGYMLNGVRYDDRPNHDEVF